MVIQIPKSLIKTQIPKENNPCKYIKFCDPVRNSQPELFKNAKNISGNNIIGLSL